jgi:hypothetical protein
MTDWKITLRKALVDFIYAGGATGFVAFLAALPQDQVLVFGITIGAVKGFVRLVTDAYKHKDDS